MGGGGGGAFKVLKNRLMCDQVRGELDIKEGYAMLCWARLSLIMLGQVRSGQ
jgi:hypothetical protein